MSYDSINTALKYATNSSGSWAASTIDNNGSVGNHTSIAVDSNNKVHISYYDSTNNAIKYATDSSGSWVTYTITRGYSPSIAVDSSNHTHISFNYGSDLYYASNASGSWGISTVDSAGSVGEYSSIAVDSTGTVHISYYDSTNRSLKYAYGLPDKIVDLADAILALQIVSGISPAVQFFDVNNDGKIGIEEAIYILQKIANIR
jgi:hypothetical protein